MCFISDIYSIWLFKWVVFFLKAWCIDCIGKRPLLEGFCKQGSVNLISFWLQAVLVLWIHKLCLPDFGAMKIPFMLTEELFSSFKPSWKTHINLTAAHLCWIIFDIFPDVFCKDVVSRFIEKVKSRFTAVKINSKWWNRNESEWTSSECFVVVVFYSGLNSSGFHYSSEVTGSI